MKRMKSFLRVFYQGGDLAYYIDSRTGKMYRGQWWTKAREPGTVRISRMPGGSGFRNNLQ